MGGINTITKTVVGTITALIRTIDNLSAPQIAFIAMSTLFVFKMKALKEMLEALKSTISSFGVFGGKGLGLPGWLTVITVIANTLILITSSISDASDKMKKLSSDAESLAKEIEYSQELIARKEEGLKTLPALAEAYSQLKQKIDAGNLSEEESVKVGKELEKTHYAIKNVVGETRAKYIEASDDIQAAVKHTCVSISIIIFLFWYFYYIPFIVCYWAVRTF